MKRIFFAFVLGLGSLSAQSFVGKISHDSYLNSKSAVNLGTLRILAVMVEFQEDRYDATTGTGKFGSHYTKIYGDTILDPLPHNANYFSDHLLFAKNYFRKVSKGKLDLTYTVLPEVITVSKTMREYSPEYQSKDFSPLGKLSEEAWKLTDQKFSNIKFSDYDLFVIFHAGVSNGLDDGIFSIDRNLPSLYLGTASLKNIFGNQFNGFPTKSGNITNSMILPETESYEILLIDNTTYLQELTINGAIVANVASHLGVPDLFNAETGRSAIGRFGLMDGQAINANNGMFPPEPSAWEKIYLGWEEPKLISTDIRNVSLSTRVNSLLTDTTLIKIPITSSEYYLLENRQQDAKKDNVILTYRRNDSTFTKEVFKDTSGLYIIIPDSIKGGGVVIDVDEFDAAVPGNGIVIWHIDEKIINEKINDNSINANMNMKGVDVEEADGIQDIGQLFSSVFGPSIGEGSREDFWYKGNPSKFYKNSFSPTTKPNSNSNSGANSLITLDNFSGISNKMSFNLSFGEGNIKLVTSKNLNLSQSKKIITSNGFASANFLYVIDNSNLNKYDLLGNLVKTIPNFSDIQPVVLKYNSTEYVIGGKGTLLNIYWKNSQEEKLKILDCTRTITAIGADASTNTPNVLVALWIPNSKAYMITLDILLKADVFTTSAYGIVEIYDKILNFGIGNSFYTMLGQSEYQEYQNYSPGDHKFLQLKSTDYWLKSVLTRDSQGNYLSVVLQKNNKFMTIKRGIIQSTFDVKSAVPINSFAVADLFNDGQNYILLANGNSLEAYNFNGITAKNFPFTIPAGEKFTGTPLAIDINRDGFSDVIAFTDKGNIYAINPVTGKILDSFPLTTGIQSITSPILFGEELPTMGPLPTYKPYLAVLDPANHLYVWNLAPTQGKSFWSGEFGDALNSSFVVASSSSQVQTEFFPIEKCYNWPNPVYGNSTNIRYYVSEDATVTIKIFDLAGELVAELNTQASGGTDNETVWDVSKIQSGIYYSNITINGDSGKSANKIIKIAVIK
ncbi:hypothetical protein C0389_09845 [bacterium]|nr:hypothetical protein [bacterium]